MNQQAEPNTPFSPSSVPSLIERYQYVRTQSTLACEPLELEDFSLQADIFTSPPKWHLAHTTWFFETFILLPFAANYQTPNPLYQHLFNSYYNGVGEQFARPNRGLLSRPTVKEVMHYRQHVDTAMLTLLAQKDNINRAAILQRTRLGIEHEQQHQELFYTDLKYSLFANPLYPAYQQKSKAAVSPTTQSIAIEWVEFEGGLINIGRDEENSLTSPFAFDNETPTHKVFLEGFCLANRLVTNAEYQAFIDDGGYQKAELWLSDGWAIVQQENWFQPLYWLNHQGKAMQFTLSGLEIRQPNQPVTHISGYEADAYANWSNARLPTEFEWEYAASLKNISHVDFNSERLHPEAASHNINLLQMFGDCWQWTGSAYRPYPGFKASEGAIGEYNGKFMANQWVLRGSSCVTQNNHSRHTYRNFFYPNDRWQFTGIRLAKNS